MEYENTLAKDISGAGKGAAVDASCKRLLADKSILAWILKDCVEEYRNSNIQDIAEKYIESEPQIAEVAVNPDETNRQYEVCRMRTQLLQRVLLHTIFALWRLLLYRES